MKKIKIEYILGIIEIIVLTLQSIFINASYFSIIGSIIILIYVLLKLIQKKPIKILENKIDVVVVLLTTTTLIPLITNKYISLNSTIIRIINYINALGIYIFFKDIFKNETIQKVFFKIIVIFSAFLVIVGIIQLCSNYTDLFSKIQHARGNGEDRLVSLLGSPNNLAPFIASVFFINLILITKEENFFKKAFYQTINFIFLVGIILTFSKITFVIFTLLILLFIIINKESKGKLVLNLLITCFIGIIFEILFEICFKRESYIAIFILLAIFSIIKYLLSIILEKYTFNFKNKKTILITFFIIVIIFIIGVIIEVVSYKEFVVFSPNLISNYNSRIISKILPNTEYSFKFNIKANAKEDNNFEISFIERDAKNKIIRKNKYSIKNGEYIEEFKIETSPNTNEIKIEFSSKNNDGNNLLIINELFINNKKIKLEYTVFPTKLVNKIKDINFGYKTLTERIVMIKNSLKLSVPNIFTGLGGKAWEYKQQEVIDYNYNSNNLHSYPFQLLLEFGIASIVIYIILVVLLICYTIKKQSLLGILMSILMIVLHSTLDVELENLFIFDYFYIMIAIYSSNINKNELNYKIYLENIILIIILIITITLGIIQNNASKTVKYFLERTKYNSNSEEYKELSKKLFYETEKSFKYEKYGYLDKYYKIIKYVVYSNIDDKKEIIDKYLEKIDKYENKELYKPASIIQKIEISADIINILQDKKIYKEQIEYVKRIIENEYIITIQQLENYSNKTYKEIDGLKSRINNIYKENKIIYKDIVKVAKSQLGTIGGEKYYIWYGYKEEVPWCACFVSWCIDRSKENMPKFASCEYGVSWFKRENRWQIGGTTPKKGDIIFFDKKDDKQDGIADHVGIVEKYDETTETVYTIQGNTPNNACEEKTYDVHDKSILGYGVK